VHELLAAQAPLHLPLHAPEHSTEALGGVASTSQDALTSHEAFLALRTLQEGRPLFRQSIANPAL
jgi:hypothetical protein